MVDAMWGAYHYQDNVRNADARGPASDFLA
jgi:hypothetical protein